MYLWIDLWDKRCWIAVEVEWVVLPKWIILRPKLVWELKKLVQEYAVECIVVWLPYDLYGKDKKQLEKTKVFIEKLKNIFPKIVIQTEDERYSSFEAEQVLEAFWEKDFHAKKDDISAVVILERFLEKKWK